MRYTTMLLGAAALLGAASSAIAQLPGGTARPADARQRAEAPPPYVTRQRDVEIPFSVKSGDSPARQPAAVRVFVSWDRGQSWHFYQEKTPDEGSFRFQPKQDGEFWFATQTVDRSGGSDNPQPREPQLRLVIDTQKPQLLAQASVARAGEVTLTWSAADPTLQPTSLKIEFQDAAGSGGTWQEVQRDPTAMNLSAGQATGRTTFEPEVAGNAINLRAEVADAAGNVAYFSQRISLSVPHSARPQNGASAPPVDRTATRWPSANPFAEPAVNDRAFAAADGGDEPEDQSPAPQIVSNPFARRDSLTSSAAPPVSAEQLPAPDAARDVLPAPQSGPPVSTPLTAAPRSVSREPDDITPLAEDDLPPPETTPAPQPEQLPAYTPDTQAAEEPVDAPPGSRTRFTNTQRFSLDYDVEAVGPEGLADVELWGTSDGGKTWAKWGADPDKQSPFDVEVNGEAQYGFRVVIVGKSGLASNAPLAGDAADIWVGIDLTRPTARLVSAAYGQGEAAGKLDIRWEASDANLLGRPVTLAIGERPDGPFTPVAAGLPNSGQHFWEFDPRSPRLIYLRLEVRDEAGNLAIDQLTEPIRVEGLQPKGRIRGFAPGENPGGAFGQPMFR